MVDLGELHSWIDTYNFSRPKRNLNRDFSDAVLLAELLKQHFPNAVDLHNYSSQNSTANKLENWATLNRKVLKKMKLGISRGMIEQVATATPGAIEKVLAHIKESIERRNQLREKDNDSDSMEELSEYSGPTLKVPVKVKNGTEEVVVEQKFTSEIVAKKLQDLAEKTEAINILNQKVDHLDSLLRLKDQRIEDLTRQLHRYQSFGQLMKNLAVLSPKTKTDLTEECD